MTTYIIDTGGWIEYFIGSEKGKKVEQILGRKDSIIITAESTIAEIFSWTKTRNLSFPQALEALTRMSQMQEIHLNLWIEAMSIRADQRKIKPKFGIMDALIVATSNIFHATIVTTDTDFSGLPNVLLLK